jgi:hypothetical protein
MTKPSSIVSNDSRCSEIGGGCGKKEYVSEGERVKGKKRE